MFQVDIDLIPVRYITFSNFQIFVILDLNANRKTKVVPVPKQRHGGEEA